MASENQNAVRDNAKPQPPCVQDVRSQEPRGPTGPGQYERRGGGRCARERLENSFRQGLNPTVRQQTANESW